MIIDLPRFIDTERPSWTELERLLDRLEKEPQRGLSLEEAKRLHLLYQRVGTDLGGLPAFASEPQLRSYLESLTARAYAEIHETRSGKVRFHPWRWFVNEF